MGFRVLIMHLLGRFRRSIRTEVFISHLLVVATASLAVIVSTLVLAPRFSDDALRHLRGVEDGGTFDSTIISNTQDAIEETMFTSTTIAVVIASVVAGTIAFLVARQIVEPIRQVSSLGERMAAGDYSIRVPITSEDEVGELARSFNTLAEALESNEDRRLRLLGDVAHELRTPLSTLQGNLEGLLDEVITPAPILWTSLLRETRRLRKLVDDLHELSRADANQIQMEITPFDPVELVEHTLRGIWPQFEEKGVKLRSEAKSPLPHILADEDRTAQVLMIVLSNALRYTPPGGLVTVNMDATDCGSRVGIEIRDTGPGISAEDLPHVFERFFRADSARATGIGGTGIGLTIARAFMEQQQGTIAVRSLGRGKGTTVMLDFPIADLD